MNAVAADPRIRKLGKVPLTSAVKSVMLGYQGRWCADETPVKIAEKSRRVGLTWAEAGDSVLLAARTNGMDVWYISYNKDMAQEFIRDCAEWAKHYGEAVSEIEETEEIFWEGDERKAILAYVIRFASGWRITALSSRPSNLRGKQGRVIVDEAAFVENLGELLKAAMALLMWGGQVHIISTHNGADNEFNELVQEVLAGKKPYSLHKITLDDAIADGLYQRICMVLDRPWAPADDAAWRAELVAFYGDDADEELFCIPANSGGKYLSLSLIEARMVAGPEVLRFACKKGFETEPDQVRSDTVQEWLDEKVLPHLMLLDKSLAHDGGWDFGRSGDLSVFTPLIEYRSLKKKTPFVVELRNMPFRQQEQVCFFILDRLPKLGNAAFDARGNGQYLAEVAMQRYGAKIHQIMPTEKFYAENFPPLKGDLEDGTVSDLPKDRDLRDDLRAIEVVRGTPRIPEKRTKGSDAGQRHGDFAVSLLMAHFASRQAKMEYGYEPVRTRRGPDEDDRHRDIRTTGGFKNQRGVL